MGVAVLFCRNVLNNLFPFCVSTVICETLSEEESRGLEGHVGLLFPTGKSTKKRPPPASYKKQVVAGNFITRAGPALKQ